MNRCHGKTKSGARCKKTARAGSRFCAIHAGEAPGSQHVAAAGSVLRARDSVDTLLALAAAGAIIVAVLAARRLFRSF